VSTLDDLRRKGTSIYEVHLDGPVPALGGVDGVVETAPLDGGVRVTVSGPPTALLAELARHPVTTLRSRDPNLEEVFLSYYGGSDQS
jgi:ABC-2 type transport system ATP-binding protein